MRISPGRIFRALALSACVLALAPVAACVSAAGAGVGSMLASVAGEPGSAYEGIGDFHTTRGSGPDERPVVFTLSSRGFDHGDVATFAFIRYDGGRPAAGRYPLRLVDVTDPGAAGFGASFTRERGDTTELFAAESGELVVTRSSPGEMEGTFRFIAMRYCLIPPYSGQWVGQCGERPARPIPGALRIEIAGSFQAVLLRP